MKTVQTAGMNIVLYRKIAKYSDTRKICCNHPKIQTNKSGSNRVMHPKDTDRMANSVDPDHSTPLGAV